MNRITFRFSFLYRQSRQDEVSEVKDKDVEKGLEQVNPLDELDQPEEEEEEGCMDKLLPDCIKRVKPRILLVLLVGWGLAADTIISLWDVVSDYLLAKEHFDEE